MSGGGGGSNQAKSQADTEEGRELWREQAGILRESKPLLKEQTGLIREQVGLLRDQKPLLKEQTGLIREQAETARHLRGISREQWDLYKKHGIGALKDLTAKIKGYATPTRIRKMTGEAAADVRAAYGQQRKGLTDMLGRYGIRPGSGKFTSALRSLALGEAGDTAGAMQRTRTGILDRDISLTGGLVDAWSGRSSAALSGLGAAGAGLGSAAAGLTRGAQGVAAGLGSAASGLGRGYFEMARGLGAAGSNFANLGMNERNAYAQEQAGLWGGIGSLAGSLGAAWIMSDERVKRNIRPIGKVAEGLTVYEFQYIDQDEDDKEFFTGVLAHELVFTHPHYVRVENDYLYVDYFGLMEELAVSDNVINELIVAEQQYGADRCQRV